MNVLHSIASLAQEDGGPTRCVPGLCLALTRQQQTAVWLVCHRAEGGVPGDGRVHFSTAMASGYWGVARELERVMGVFKPDILHGHGIWLPGNHATAVAARRHGLPLVITPHGMLQAWALRQKPWKKWLALQLYQRRDLRQAACLHVTAAAEAVHLRRLGFSQPLAIIPNGIDVPDDVLTAAVGEGRAAGRLDGDSRRTVLFLSRLHRKKGILDLVQAWAPLRPAGWRVLLAGPDEGGHRREVETAIQSAGVAADFSFLGPLDDVRKWMAYRAADLFVLPSYGENFALVVAEALAAGVPVITTRAAPWADLVGHRCGWWTEIGAAPLGMALREAIALDDATRHAMGERGRNLVRAEYLWPALAAKMRSVYDWLGGRCEPPACIQTWPG